MELKKITGLLLPFVLSCSGCQFSDAGYRFHAVYQAKKTGCRIQLLSQGYVKSGHDLADSALSLVQFCPLPGSPGKPFRVVMLEDPTPYEWIKVECADLGMPLTEWKNSPELLSGLLSKAGYEGIVPEEVKGLARVMTNSLAGSKGVVLEGQIDSIDVLRTKIEYAYEGHRNKPQREWIDDSALSRCER